MAADRLSSEGEIVEVIQVISQEPVVSQERFQERIAEQPVNVAEPLVKEEIVDGAQQPSPQEHIQERIVKQGVDIPVPRVTEDFVAVVHLTPQERSPKNRHAERGYPSVR